MRQFFRCLAFFHVRNIHVSFHSLTDPPRGTSTIHVALKGKQQQSTARDRYSTEEVLNVSNSFECMNILLIQPAGQHQEIVPWQDVQLQDNCFLRLALPMFKHLSSIPT